MSIIKSGFFVLGGIAVGAYMLNTWMNPGDALPRNARMGAWREAQVRPACYEAVDVKDQYTSPKLPSGPHKIDFGDYSRAVQLTAALNCYVVTQKNAVCEPNNRAWIVDYIGRYYSKMDAMLASAKRVGEAEVAKVRQVWNSPQNQAINRALENFIREGKLANSDFGWSSPDALKPLFAKYSGAADQCSPLRAASR
jgi:hypothetical protein